MPATKPLCERIERGGNKTAVVFVHGLMGDYRKTWGRFPELVCEDSDLAHCDALCWGYPSTIPWLPLPFVGRRLPELPLVSEALRTSLTNGGPGSSYDDLVLVAHSMGGLIVLRMILDALKKDDAKLLRRIRHVVLYATPTQGAQVPAITWVHRQAWSLRQGSEFVDQLTAEWQKASAQDEIPFGVTAVVALQDKAVDEESAKAFWPDIRVIPGSHTEMCKPDSRAHQAFTTLKGIITEATVPHFICSVGRVKEINRKIVEEAVQELYSTGSRGRDRDYFNTIEKALEERPGLHYYRVLMGPPRKKCLKEHLLKVLMQRDPRDRSQGAQSVHLGLYPDSARQAEAFICGNEKMCLVVLPGATGGVGDYSTAAIFTDDRLVQGYSHLVKALYESGRRLETRRAVEALEVLEPDAQPDSDARGSAGGSVGEKDSPLALDNFLLSPQTGRDLNQGAGNVH